MNKEIVTHPATISPLTMSHLIQSSISTMGPYIDIADDFSEFSDIEDIPDSDSDNGENIQGKSNRATGSRASVDNRIYKMENQNDSMCSASSESSTSHNSQDDIIYTRHNNRVDTYMNTMEFRNKHNKNSLALSKTKSNKTASSMNSQNTNSTTNEELIDALPYILDKFDVLFPFYRLSDKNCKQLSLFVLSEINSIDKIFCNAKGRCLEAVIYYYDSPMPKKMCFYNRDEPDSEISQWKDIKMTTKYGVKNVFL